MDAKDWQYMLKPWARDMTFFSLCDIPSVDEDIAVTFFKSKNINTVRFRGDSPFANQIIDHLIASHSSVHLYSPTVLQMKRVLAANKTFTEVSFRSQRGSEEFPVKELALSPMKTKKLVIENLNVNSNVPLFKELLERCEKKGVKELVLSGLVSSAEHFKAFIPFARRNHMTLFNGTQSINILALEVVDAVDAVEKGRLEQRALDDLMYKAVQGPLGTTRFYDLVLDVSSMSQVIKDGWTLHMHNAKATKAIEATSVVACIIGDYNRGKTYIISKLTGEELPSGVNVHTVGLSFKKLIVNGCDVLVLDTAGFNSAVDHVTPEVLSEKKAEENFLREVSFEMADVLIYVMLGLTSKDQLECHRISTEWRNKGKSGNIVVIHNLYNETGKDEVTFEREWTKLVLAYTSHQVKEIQGVRFLKGCTKDASGSQDHFVLGHDSLFGESNKRTLDFIRQTYLFPFSKKTDALVLNVKDTLTAAVNKHIPKFFTSRLQVEAASTSTVCAVCSQVNDHAHDCVCLLEKPGVRACNHVFHARCKTFDERCVMCRASFTQVCVAEPQECQLIKMRVPPDADIAACKLREQSLGVYLMSTSTAPQEVLVTDTHLILCIEAPGLQLKRQDVQCKKEHNGDVVVSFTAPRTLPPWILEKQYDTEAFRSACTRTREDFVFETRICFPEDFPKKLREFAEKVPQDTLLYRSKENPQGGKPLLGNGILTIEFEFIREAAMVCNGNDEI